MVAVAPLCPVHRCTADEEQRVLLTSVPWSTYVVLRDSVGSPGVRMTYLEGMFEIMSPSRSHEVDKKFIARLLKLFYLEREGNANRPIDTSAVLPEVDLARLAHFATREDQHAALVAYRGEVRSAGR
jgi:hypothetical protein